ncbi:MAG: hypothetical protein AAFU60_08120, partial [Bacteroidota bacterium]
MHISVFFGSKSNIIPGSLLNDQTFSWDLDVATLFDDDGIASLVIEQTSGNDVAFASKENGNV